MIVRANATTAVVVRKAPTTWGSGVEVVDLVGAETREAEEMESDIIQYVIRAIYNGPINWREVVTRVTNEMSPVL